MNKIILQNKKENISLPELYERYSKDIFKYSFSILKNNEEAEDAVHEVFVKYAESENSFKGECSYKTWLLIITRNYCFSRIRNKNFRNEDIDDENFRGSFEPDYDSHISLRDALMKLSEEHNELIYLKEYEGFSYKEIAEITKLSLENVKIKLFRARQELRKILKGDG
ncbi:MAG: RNA polymerase sigma factor [Bacteroidetes bacterium]|nr:RNA polymerase sigma factor [Bacteroidota bacterium]